MYDLRLLLALVFISLAIIELSLGRCNKAAFALVATLLHESPGVQSCLRGCGVLLSVLELKVLLQKFGRVMCTAVHHLNFFRVTSHFTIN